MGQPSYLSDPTDRVAMSSTITQFWCVAHKIFEKNRILNEKIMGYARKTHFSEAISAVRYCHSGVR
jgi:hypothetical protein